MRNISASLHARTLIVLSLLFFGSYMLHADLGYSIWIEFEMEGVKYFLPFESGLRYTTDYKKHFPSRDKVQYREELFHKIVYMGNYFNEETHDTSKIMAWRSKHWLDLSLLHDGNLREINEPCKEYIFTKPISLSKKKIIQKGRLIDIFPGNIYGGFVSPLIKTADNEWIRKSRMVLLFEDEFDTCQYSFYAARGRFSEKEINALKREFRTKQRKANIDEVKIFNDLYKRKIIARSFCSC